MVGSNYWGTPDGTGFSEADVDADRDGFCGHAYHLSTGNINSYPLAGVSSPIAGLSANVTNGTAPLAIGFMDVTAGFPTRWTWEFGDSTTATVQNPIHAYTHAGIYQIRLIAAKMRPARPARRRA